MDDYAPRRFDISLDANILAIELLGKIFWCRIGRPCDSIWGIRTDWHKGWFYMLSLGRIEIGCRISYKEITLQ